jgi:hypothetical protein
MRRGETARVFDQTYSLADTYKWLLHYLGILQRKALTQVAADDPTVEVRGLAGGLQLQFARGGRDAGPGARVMSGRGRRLGRCLHLAGS